MLPGFLVVFAEPGQKVSLEEFQDWYNNEHVPLRLNHLPSFLTGARYSASDSLRPSWLALYDIDSTSTFQDESYTRLRANRSPREADLVQRLEILDRRTYELIEDSGESPLTSSFASTDPTKMVITHGISVTDSDQQQKFAEWTKKALLALKGVEGWVRTRTYTCIDNLKTGTYMQGKENGQETQIVPKYLAVHELLSRHAAESTAFKNVIREIGVSDVQVEVVEDRRWELYRAYPSIAQGNTAIASIRA